MTKIKYRIRHKVSGTAEQPRLCVCRTGAHIYCQVIDDEKGCTLASAATVEKEFRAQKLAANVKSAEIIGKAVAERAIECGMPGRNSMDRHMVCGVGACYACIQKTVRGNSRCCVEGPVFRAEDLVW